MPMPQHQPLYPTMSSTPATAGGLPAAASPTFMSVGATPPIGAGGPVPQQQQPAAQPTIVVQPVIVRQRSTIDDALHDLEHQFSSAFSTKKPVAKVGACYNCRTHLQYMSSSNGSAVAVQCYQCRTINQFK